MGCAVLGHREVASIFPPSKPYGAAPPARFYHKASRYFSIRESFKKHYNRKSEKQLLNIQNFRNIVTDGAVKFMHVKYLIITSFIKVIVNSLQFQFQIQTHFSVLLLSENHLPHRIVFLSPIPHLFIPSHIHSLSFPSFIMISLLSLLCSLLPPSLNNS